MAGRTIRLIDTAGMRRRSRIEAKLEAASVADTLDAIRWPTSWSSCSTPPTCWRSRTSPSPAG
jgi:hypothetical protein